tara:strand:+ start:1592 stop:2785 length:1194 start_codon:yes stop_codon:yes gene_type:complete
VATNTFQKTSASWGLIGGLLLLMSPMTANADIKTVSVKGEAAIIKGDKDQGLKDAKREARRRAVEEGAGVLVQSNTVVRNFQLVSDEITTSAKGVIVEEQWGKPAYTDNSVSVELTAKVSPEAIQDAMCTIIKANHDPKVALVFAERVGKHGMPYQKKISERGPMETLFTQALMDSCFTIVEPGVAITEISSTGDIPKATIDEIASNADAQYILIGKADTLYKEASGSFFKGTGMKPYTVASHIKLFSVETLRVEATATANHVIPGTNSLAILNVKDDDDKGRKKIETKVVAPIMDELFGRIAKRWSSDLVNAAQVQVIVKGIKKYRDAKSFVKAVKGAFSGVTINQRGVKNGQGTFDLALEGGSDAFAAKMDGSKAAGREIVVLEVTRGKIVLELK